MTLFNCQWTLLNGKYIVNLSFIEVRDFSPLLGYSLRWLVYALLQFIFITARIYSSHFHGCQSYAHSSSWLFNKSRFGSVNKGRECIAFPALSAPGAPM